MYGEHSASVEAVSGRYSMRLCPIFTGWAASCSSP
jgi:hypothetical protein